MGSIHGSHDWRCVVVSDGDGPVKVAQWLTQYTPDPSAEELQSLATAYSISESKFGTPVTARVVKAMRPGPYWSLLDADQYQLLAGLNADGSVGTAQSNADPNGSVYGITVEDQVREALGVDIAAEVLVSGEWMRDPGR